MVGVAQEQPFGLVQGQAAGDLWLRVVGSSLNGQLIRLSSPKCTVGSSQHCTLRLRAAGVRPVHCLILRGSHGTVIRSCGADTRLNGSPFMDAALAPGDRLKVGPIELEVLASNDPDSMADVPGVARTTTPQQPNPTDGLTEGRLRDQVKLGRDRTRKLVEAVRGLKAESAHIHEQSASDQSEHAVQLENERRQLAEDHQELVARLENERLDWESSRQTTRAEFQTRNSELERERTELDAARHALEQQRQQIESDTKDAQHGLEQQADAHARAQDELSRLRTEFDQAQSDLAHRRERFEQERAEAQGVIDDRRAALEQACQASAVHDQQEQSRLAGNKAELDAGWADLDQQRHQFEVARQSAVAEQDQAAAGLADERGQLNAQRAQLEAREAEIADRDVVSHQRQAELEDRQREMNDELEELERRRIELQDTLADLDGHRADVDEARAAVGHARTELEQAQAELNRRLKEWEQERGETEAAKAELERLRVELDAERTQTVEAKASVEQSQLELELSFDDLRQQCEQLAAAQAELGLAEGDRTDSTATDTDEIVDENTLLAAVLSMNAERLAWALEQGPLEPVLVTGEDQFDCRNVEPVQPEQPFDSQVEHQRVFEEQSAQIREQADALETARQEFSAQRQQEEGRLLERAAALDRETNEFEVRHEQRDIERTAEFARHEETVVELRNRLAESDQRYAASCERESQIEADHREMEMEREKLEKSSEQISQKLTELEQLRAALIEERDALRRQHAANHEGARCEEPAASSNGDVATETDAPPSTGEDGFAETGSVDARFATARPADVAPETDETNASGAAEASEGEESIEHHVAAWLHRIRGGGAQIVVPVPEPARNKRKSDVKKSDAKQPDAKQPDASELRAARKPADFPLFDVPAETHEMVPRAAEEFADLSAMRELANSQARLAIDAHGRKRLVHTALVMSSAALGCLVATMLVLSLVEQHHTAFRTLAMGGFVGVVFWLFTAATALQQLDAARRSRQAGLRDNIERADHNKSA